jgi:hypothetical protein
MSKTSQVASAFFPIHDRMEMLRAIMASLTEGEQPGTYIAPPFTPSFALETAGMSTDRGAIRLGSGYCGRRIAHGMASVTFALAALLRETPGCVPDALTLSFSEIDLLPGERLVSRVLGDGPTKCVLASTEGNDAHHRSIIEIDARTTPDTVNSFELELLALWFTAAFLVEEWPTCLVVEQRLVFPGRAVKTTGAICVHITRISSRKKVVKSGMEGSMIIAETRAETAHGITVAEGTTVLFLPSVG